MGPGSPVPCLARALLSRAVDVVLARHAVMPKAAGLLVAERCSAASSGSALTGRDPFSLALPRS
jgi:hypothetical protein